MKSLVVTLAFLCAVAVAGTIFYLHSQKTPPNSAPVAEISPAQTRQTPSEKIAAPKQESQPAVSQDAGASAQIPVATPAVGETAPDDSTNSIHKLVKALLSAKNGDQKHKVFQQLLQAGQLDAAIAELQQRASDNPNVPEIPTTLGEALLNKARATLDANGGQNSDEIGILAMQADQDFNAALKIDPQNWEAQFVKASSMFYWPASPQVDNQVVQNLSGLIDQQETMPTQPQFAQPYVVLGNEYQKLGEPDKAQATWQLGLTKFPNDATLQKKISNPSAQ